MIPAALRLSSIAPGWQAPSYLIAGMPFLASYVCYFTRRISELCTRQIVNFT